jgi:hypothetical protein
MPDATAATQVTNAPPSSTVPDWDSLAHSLGTTSAEEAQRRAYEIAKFVADVESDKDSELILKTGGRNLALKLNR